MIIGDIKVFCRFGAILVGPNSSGKSTVLKRMNSFVKNGQIAIDGQMHRVTYIDATTISSSATNVQLVERLRAHFYDNILQRQHEHWDIGDDESKTKRRDGLREWFENRSNRSKFELLETGIRVSYKIDKTGTDVDSFISLDNVTYEAKALSSGVLSVVYHFLEGFTNEVSSSRLLIIDEIESFLHPEWVWRIAKIISNNIWIHSKVIIATHSPILVSYLIRPHLEMLSVVEWAGKTPVIRSLNMRSAVDCVRRAFVKRVQIFSEAKPVDVSFITKDYVEKQIIACFTQENSMLFFWKNPVIVEGSTEKIFLELVYRHPVVSADGFYQFPIFARILWLLGIKARFIIDSDKSLGHMSGTKEPPKVVYNKYVQAMIKRFKDEKGGNFFSLFVFEGSFDIFLHGKSVRNHEKIPLAVGMTPPLQKLANFSGKESWHRKFTEKFHYLFDGKWLELREFINGNSTK